ncbi:hypothetical protein PLESTF_001265300 [Pleodorina starrii]|nr:hypothetical protein PLESTF_001265300 [Pleodorina starrii]
MDLAKQLAEQYLWDLSVDDFGICFSQSTDTVSVASAAKRNQQDRWERYLGRVHEYRQGRGDTDPFVAYVFSVRNDGATKAILGGQRALAMFTGETWSQAFERDFGGIPAHESFSLTQPQQPYAQPDALVFQLPAGSLPWYDAFLQHTRHGYLLRLLDGLWAMPDYDSTKACALRRPALVGEAWAQVGRRCLGAGAGPGPGSPGCSCDLYRRTAEPCVHMQYAVHAGLAITPLDEFPLEEGREYQGTRIVHVASRSPPGSSADDTGALAGAPSVRPGDCFWLDDGSTGGAVVRSLERGRGLRCGHGGHGGQCSHVTAVIRAFEGALPWPTV